MKIKAIINRQHLYDRFSVGTNVYITDSESDAFNRIWYCIVNPSHPTQTDIVEPSTLEILYKTQRNLMTLRLHLLLDKLENEY